MDKQPIIHYHKDTVDIHLSLVVNSVYNTTKGRATYEGRSISNGKLIFIMVSNSKKISFTKLEWEAGNKAVVDTAFMQRELEVKERKEREPLKGLVSGKTMLEDITSGFFGGKAARYLGDSTPDSKTVRYENPDGSGMVVNMKTEDFNNRFDLLDI